MNNLIFVNIVCFCLIILAAFNISIEDTSEIKIFNPFKYDVKIELKCNWEKDHFTYYKKYKLNGNSNITVSVPNSSKCQVWPGR